MKKLILIILAAISISCSKDDQPTDEGYQPDGHQISVTYECNGTDVEHFCVSEATYDAISYLVTGENSACTDVSFTDLQGNHIEAIFFMGMRGDCPSVTYYD